MMEKLYQNSTYEDSRKLRELHGSGKSSFKIQANNGDFNNGDLEGHEALNLEVIVKQEIQRRRKPAGLDSAPGMIASEDELHPKTRCRR
jgi:hypothetical protein